MIDVDAPRDTCKDADIACDLFVKLNCDALGIPGDGALVILSDSDEEATEAPAALPLPGPPSSTTEKMDPSGSSSSSSSSSSSGGEDDDDDDDDDNPAIAPASESEAHPSLKEE